MESRKPKYKLGIGDLVRITDKGIELEITKTKPNVGVVASEAYSYLSTECGGPELDAAMVELEHWCYDILFGDEITKMMPEVFIEPLTKQENK